MTRFGSLRCRIGVKSLSFIHCADIHLDSPLRGLAAQEGHAPRLIRSACRMAFEIQADHAINEGVAFVVIAGDLSGTTLVDPKARPALMVGQISRF